MVPREFSITCHCGIAAQTVAIIVDAAAASDDNEGATMLGIDLCHCETCRHNTGVLFTSYLRISYDGMCSPVSLKGLTQYPAPGLRGHHEGDDGSSRFFCATCGCHIFMRSSSGEWAVATGVMARAVDENGEELEAEEGGGPLIEYVRHVGIEPTGDGGLSTFLKPTTRSSSGLQVVERRDSSLRCFPMSLDHAEVKMKSLANTGEKARNEEDVLNGSCHCGTVRFHITRPDATSRLPRSNFPDLIVPYHTGSPPLVENPEDEKWWLCPSRSSTSDDKGDSQQHRRDELTRYLAGTCACRSCRLSSGFEIQTWAFIPRTNISFHVPGSTTTPSETDKPSAGFRFSSEDTETDETLIIPLDFDSLPSGILKSYESKPGVRREFCARCGATVFWRDRWRPELMDVSVGLLDATEGALARDWLCWYTKRVSFAEEAGTGRGGWVAKWGRELVDDLERGLRAWGGDT